jgi:hypothetical protein
MKYVELHVNYFHLIIEHQKSQLELENDIYKT